MENRRSARPRGHDISRCATTIINYRAYIALAQVKRSSVNGLLINHGATLFQRLKRIDASPAGSGALTAERVYAD